MKMNKQETLKVITYLREAFPNGSEVTQNTVNVWHDILGGYEFRVVWECMRQVAIEWDGYTMPPPAAIIKKMRTAQENNHIELWNIAEKMIRKGTILTVGEFRDAPVEIQTWFGDVSRIRELALMPPEQTANERARFLKGIPAIKEKIQTRKSLSNDVLTLIDGLAERKQIC